RVPEPVGRRPRPVVRAPEARPGGRGVVRPGHRGADPPRCPVPPLAPRQARRAVHVRPAGEPGGTGHPGPGPMSEGPGADDPAPGPRAERWSLRGVLSITA